MKVIFNNSSKSTKTVSRVEKFSYLTISFSLSEKVFDEVRGFLIYGRKNSWSFKKISDYVNYPNKKQIKILAIILESPHKDEYFNNIPIRIANGVTGTNIENEISNRPKILNLLDKKYDYEVYLLNAVQYQCSCYKVLKDAWDHTNRNHVFKLLFSNKGFKLNRDFIDRLEDLSPYYVINCVTKQLKKIVGDEIKNNYSLYNKNKYEEDYHPSCWK